MKKESKSKLKEQIENSTIHALPNIIKTKNKLSQTIWSIFFIVSLALCCYFTFTKIHEYLDFSVITNMNIINEKSSQFPTITICKLSDPNPTNFIINCSFNNITCNFLKKNSYCYVFNLGYRILNRTLIPSSIENSTRNGLSHGLKVTLENKGPIGTYTVYINNHSVNADTLYLKQITNGLETNFIIKRTFIEKLSYPFSNCQRKVTFNTHNASRSYPYFQSECFEICYKFQIAEACNFSAMLLDVNEMYYSNRIAFYDAYQSFYINCSAEILHRVLTNKLNKGLHEICGKKCPVDCDFLCIHIEPRYVLKESEADTSLAYLNIYYENLEYVLIKEIPKMTSEDLFGHVGGFLGLFLGLSVLSIGEIFELISLLIASL